MKTKTLAAVAAIGGLAFAGAASAQLVGGSVGGGVTGAVGGSIGQTTGVGAGVGAGASGGVTAQTPPINTPSTPLPSTGKTGAVPLPGSTPSVSTPAAGATVNGSANANASATAATAPSALSGINPGMAVRDAKGKALGKVSRVVKRADGTISAVEVAAASQAGKTMSLEPSTLSVASGVVTYSNTSASATPQ